MTTKEIATRLAELCQAGEFKTCYEELYSPEIQSIENDGSMIQGFEAMAAKGKEWNETIETFHASGVGEPAVSGNYFSMPMWMEITYKGAPGPIKFEEMCVYQVKDSKVVKEQFFYDEPNA